MTTPSPPNSSSPAASGSTPGGSDYAFVNVVTAFGVDPTGSVDAGAPITAALATLTAKGQAAWIPAGTYLIATPINPPNGSIVWADSAATFKSNQAATGQNASCILYRVPTPLATPNVGTIHTPPVVGATSVVVDLATSKPVIGNWIQLGYPGAGINNAQVFKVVSVTGSSSPYTVTLDRPILYPFTSGSNATTGSLVQEFSAIPQDIRWYGNGCTFTGTGDLYIELLAAWKCLIADVNMNTSGGHPDGGGGGAALDAGSRECMFERLTCDLSGALPWAGSVPPYGILLDSTENSIALECSARNCAGGASFYVDGVAGTTAQNCHDEGGSAIGFQFGDTLGLGAFDCVTIGCTASSPIGFNPRQSQSCKIDQCSARGVAQAVVIATGAIATKVSGFDASNVTTHAMSISGDVDVEGLDALGIASVISIVEIGGGAVVRLKDVRMQASVTANGIVTDGSFSGRCEIDGFNIELDGASSFAIYHQGGVILASNVKTSGSGSGCTGAEVATAGATLRLENGNDFSSCTTSLAVAGGAFCNRKQTVTGSAGGQAVSWPDLKSTDVIPILIPKSAVFTGWVSAFTPGTGFTVKDAAGGTYEYFIP